ASLGRRWPAPGARGVPAPQHALEERRDLPVGVEQVLEPREAVTLVGVEQELAGPPELLERLDDLPALVGRAARVVPPGRQQQRGADPVQEEDRGAVAEQR